MIPTTPLPMQPESWQRLWREAITDPNELLDYLGLPQLKAQLAVAGLAFPLRVPRGFVARMRHGDPHDPLLRQVLPLDAEDRRVPGFQFDAVGDLAARSAPGVLQKYSHRVLLIATGSCAIHCRYCFRRHFPYSDELAAREHWRAAVAEIAAHPDIHEVLLSGGDPWSLSTGKLRELTDRLCAIAHLKRLRIHTRLPIVLPERVDAELCAWLASLPWPTVVVIHANHAREIDASVSRALARLRATGVTLLNQVVLLAGVNDSIDAQEALALRLFESGVLPYYLHLLDPVHGTAHFDVEEGRAREIVDALRGRLPGYLVPKLVRELPGEASKTPVG